MVVSGDGGVTHRGIRIPCHAMPVADWVVEISHHSVICYPSIARKPDILQMRFCTTQIAAENPTTSLGPCDGKGPPRDQILRRLDRGGLGRALHRSGTTKNQCTHAKTVCDSTPTRYCARSPTLYPPTPGIDVTVD
jgi:hypothetical protein